MENMDKENEIAQLCYKGNSVGYIYDKMQCYREQIMTMINMLQIIGIDYGDLGKDNFQRRIKGLQEAEQLREKLDKTA